MRTNTAPGLALAEEFPIDAGADEQLQFLLRYAIPLVPFFFSSLNPSHMFAFSAALTAIAFTVVGFVKGVVLGQSRARSSLETLLIGGAAAALAYLAGAWLRRAYGI